MHPVLFFKLEASSTADLGPDLINWSTLLPVTFTGPADDNNIDTDTQEKHMKWKNRFHITLYLAQTFQPFEGKLLIFFRL